jgi:Dyp-type peroxidase family
MALTLNETAIDYRDPQFDKMLSNLQGNILKGHGRNHTTHIFIKFKPNKLAKARSWVQSFAEEKVVTMKQQLRERELFKRNKVDTGTFAAMFLSAKGYKYFEYNLQKFTEPAYKTGMKSRQADLKDPVSTEWESGFQDDADMMILVADANQDRMGRFVKEILETDDFVKSATVLTIEYGHAIRNANGDGLEHFGYVDGISQPLFLKDELDSYFDFHLPPIQFDPTAKLNLVLLKDPFGGNDDAYGSYFVFRKLAQRVKDFKEAEEAVAEELGLIDEDAERAGAMLVGRFEDGTPVTLSKEAGMIGSGAMNNFNYQNDANGAKCPFHGHIRKTNPRSGEGDKTHTMARRGITFGCRNVNTEIDPLPVQSPNEGVGLLFMSYQASIANQFEFIQRSWANDPNFPSPNAGSDPIIGQGMNSKGKLAANYGVATPASLKTVEFGRFVTMKGGEYFFAPSIPFLKNI